MNGKLINLVAFSSKLESYKNTLEEMNKLTEAEIKRVSSLGIKIVETTDLEREAAIFIHQQMDSFLDKLGSLVNEMPNYSSSNEVFLTDEIQWLQERVLVRLKELGNSEHFTE